MSFVRIIPFFSLVFVLTLPFSAAAQEIRSCGAPEDVQIDAYDPDTHDQCDIYTRQLDYRQTRLALKADLEARRESYGSASRKARARYKDDLKALNDSRGTKPPSESSPPQTSTPAGPDDLPADIK